MPCSRRRDHAQRQVEPRWARSGDLTFTPIHPMKSTPRRSRGRGGGRGGLSDVPAPGRHRVSRRRTPPRPSRRGVRGGVGQRSARSRGKKRGGWSFRPRRGDVEEVYRTRTATSSPPNAWSLCSAPFLRRSRSRRCLRSARRDSPASIGRRPSLCVGRRNARVPSFTPRNSRAHTRPTPKRSNRFLRTDYLVTKKTKNRSYLDARIQTPALKQLALPLRGGYIDVARRRCGRPPCTMDRRRRRVLCLGHIGGLQPQRRRRGRAQLRCREGDRRSHRKPRCPTSWTSRRPRSVACPSPRRPPAARGGRESADRLWPPSRTAWRWAANPAANRRRSSRSHRDAARARRELAGSVVGFTNPRTG